MRFKLIVGRIAGVPYKITSELKEKLQLPIKQVKTCLFYVI